ncbi:MAG TPA: UDP binding domain-containing protein, partial [Patescibacteria group bacterium]|nr:UDP binding domain-containing protein [Patescibacteria group bacterium]
ISHELLTFFDDPFEAGKDSDLQIFLTPWDEYKQFDLARLAGVVRNKTIYDGMRVISDKNAQANGFIYQGVGSTYSEAGAPPFTVSDNPTS